MKIFCRFIFLTFILFIGGCSNNDTIVNPIQNSGSLLLKIDRENAPQSVSIVIAKLTRTNFEPVTSQMNLHTDSTADLNLTGIAEGTWHLLVEAKNNSGFTEYAGEADVNVVANQTIQVYLTLYPQTGGTGGIEIFVTWGTRGWTDFFNNPVLAGNDNPSNPPGGVLQPKIIYDNGTYKMWYNALYNSGVTSVWYAESPDGKNWATIGNQPVLSPSAQRWDSYGVQVTSVIKEGDWYKMYYTGFDTHPFNGPWKTGLAISMDGKNWMKLPMPVLTDNEKYYRTGLSSVIKYGNSYYAYFGYKDSTYTQSYIGVAISNNGINWDYSSSNPVLAPTLSWEGNGVYYPAAVYQDGKFRLYYNDMEYTAFGYAESVDGFSFNKNAKPIFKKTQSPFNWNSIAYPFYIKANNIERIYYTGEYMGSDVICFIQNQ